MHIGLYDTAVARRVAYAKHVQPLEDEDEEKEVVTVPTDRRCSSSTNATGYLGVYPRQAVGASGAEGSGGTFGYIGVFDTQLEAAIAYARRRRGGVVVGGGGGRRGLVGGRVDHAALEVGAHAVGTGGKEP